jgi:phosphotransferase system  glucose/maltose/N-acetylglucosamine-specific IIC component
MPFIRLEVGVILIAFFLSIAHTIYKSEKGHPIVNVILAYILIFPSLYVVRFNFGKLLFRSAALIYILFVVIGIIYSIALYFASKKYKKEVDDLNQLLQENNKDKNETSE